jgi:hypothetical protein
MNSQNPIENSLQSLVLKVEAVVKEIKSDHYYLHIWKNVSHKKPLDECTRTELLKPFQDFWNALPDTKSIRTGPFFKICDLAVEWVFGEEPIDGDEAAAF